LYLYINITLNGKGLSIKDVRSQREGVFVQCGQRGSSDAYVRTFWCKKIANFSKFVVCLHGQGGVEPVRTWEEGVNIHNFVRTSFMDGP